MNLNKLVSSIYNDLYSGIAGFNANETISIEQLEDEVVEKRQGVIKDFFAKGLLKLEDLAVSLNCVEVDCKNMIDCDCGNEALVDKIQAHFEIPQLITDVGEGAIVYIGSADGVVPFKVYFSMEATKSNQYRRRRNKEPFVYVDKTPHKNTMWDC